MKDVNGVRYDVVVVGGGHNGLVSAAYLAKAGLSVLVLERLGHVGGAAVSATPFDGQPARISRYSSLVSMLPDQINSDLGLGLRFASRASASYTPVLRNGDPGGLLVERPEAKQTRMSFHDLTGGHREYDAWCSFYADVGALARAVEPTLLQPLPIERDIASQFDPATWRQLVATPLGVTIEQRFSDDTVRGVVATDALVGTFASMHDESLIQNRSFLYRMLGTGEWRVPVGGMGAVTDALARAAAQAGAEIRTNAGVSRIRPGEDRNEVTFDGPSGQTTVEARFVLANVAPWVLHILLGAPDDPAGKPQGAQLTINFLLDRLPRLKSGIDPSVAFGGTLHVAVEYSSLEAAYAEASADRLPSTMPGEVVCHTLTDPSILGDAAARHTLTFHGLHTPPGVFEADPARLKAEAVSRAVAAIDKHLDDPLVSCLARDASGVPCLEARIPQDIEAELAMPGGHMYHGHLEWPWANNRARLDTPDQAWGVPTGIPAVFLCGAGARRGGGISGIGGHNAAMAVLDAR